MFQDDRKRVCNHFDVVQNLTEAMLFLHHQNVGEAGAFLREYQSATGEYLPDIRGPGLAFTHSPLVDFLRGLSQHKDACDWAKGAKGTLTIWRKRVGRALCGALPKKNCLGELYTTVAGMYSARYFHPGIVKQP